MAQTARISCIKEPLLKETLSLNNFGSDDRGDVYCDWIDNSEAIVDCVSCNVANDTLVHRRKLNPVTALDFKAEEKHRKYDKVIEEANADRKTQLVFIAFPFSINGRLSDEAEYFLNDFQKMVQEKTMKRFDIFLWRSQIQFAIINRLSRFFNRIREALARQQADQDFVEEIDNNLFDSRRGDLIAPFVDSFQVVVDFTIVDPFASIYRDDILVSSNCHLNKAEIRKRDIYAEILDDLNRNLYSKFSFVPFAFSIFGNIGQSALNFLNDFANLCRSSGKNFAGNLWKNRIIFVSYRSVPKYLNLMMSKLYKDSSRIGVENFNSYVF
ncbi:hypothetical protein P9112_004176 [Eukaryota sp. TZLM1-RC]